MTEVLQQDGPAQRLAGEGVAWLTTAGADGQPQSSPIWFIWDGASLWLRSQAEAGKVRNITANPRVAFHLADDGYGGNIITIEGTATLEAEPPSSSRRTSPSTTRRSVPPCRRRRSSSGWTIRPPSASRPPEPGRGDQTQAVGRSACMRRRTLGR